MKKTVCLLLALFSISVAAWAQSEAATVIGTVTDPSGAVIPNVKVEVANPDKGFKRSLVSDSAGSYVIDQVPIGSCVITAEAAGFQKLVRSGITLQVSQLLRVNLQMQVGATTQEVTIVGNVPRVETETGTISHVINGSQVVDLDLNGRNFANLMYLTPGVTEANGQTFYGTVGGAGFVNGIRQGYSKFEFDGMYGGDTSGGGTSSNIDPSIDSVAEMRVTANSYEANMGLAGGSLIEVAIKSGTKEFHGGMYDFVRNTDFNANDFFQNRVVNPPGGNAPKLPMHWNDPGYYLGGPFYIPGVYNQDKTKTFFFWSQEFHRYRTGVVINTSAPTLLERQGNFSECDKTSANYNATVAAGCILPKIPGSGGQLYPNDILPVDPDATDLLNAWVPLPNSGPNGYVKSPSNPTNWGQQTVRVDQNISDRTAAMFRFTHDSWYWGTFPPTNTYSGATYDTQESQQNRLGFNAVFRLTHSVNPHLMSTFMLGVTSDMLLYGAPALVGKSSVAGSFEKPANWTAHNIFAVNEANNDLPGVSSPYTMGPELAGVGVKDDFSNSAPAYVLKDDWVDVAGNHTLKFGLFAERAQKNEHGGMATDGIYSFSGGSSANSTGNSLADEDIGALAFVEEGTQTVGGTPVGGYAKFFFRFTDVEPYFQDDWKVTRKLTLNLGLRYTYYQPNHEISNPPKNSTFIPGLYNPAAQAQLNAGGYLIAGTGAWFHSFGNGLVECGANGIPPSCSLATEANVAPRFGFAYDPTGSGKTVIRGGYGLFYDLGGTGIAGSQSFESNAPTEFTSFAYNISGYTNITPGLLGPVALTVMPTKHKWMVVQQYNLTVQHEFPGKNLLSVGYVGTLSHHLPISVNINQIPEGVTTENVPALAGATGCDSLGNCNVQSILINKQHSSVFFVPYRGYTTILSEEGVSNSNYNALQAEFTHPFGHGLMVQASYAWSHSLDDASTYYSNTFFDSTNIERNYGSSDFNRPQSLLLSYVYSLPFFSHPSNTLLSKSLSQTLGGWRISGITSFFSGVPFTPTCGVSGYSTAINGSTLCNPVGPVKAQKSTISIPTYGPTPAVFSGSEIAQPLLSQLNSNGEPGMFGYLGKNVLTGPGRNNFDLALLKDFRMPWFGGERSRLEFRAETFNTFNHPNWDGLNTGCSGTTTFGQPCTGTANASLGAVNADWGPRALQLALKLTF